ncbi:HAD family hydrolase [Spiroplasma clarkii]|uniref:HAD family hydrolase n=1 Tax=Spiroplasma clarkii TaxID=2139 RepID=UPI0011BA5AEA
MLESRFYFTNHHTLNIEFDATKTVGVKIKPIDQDFDWETVAMITFECLRSEVDYFQSYFQQNDFKIEAIYSAAIYRDKPLFMLTAANVSKASAIAALNQKLAIKDNDVYIFGDGVNDLTMIQKYYNQAYVPNSAPKCVQAEAKNIIGSAEADCVGEILIEIFNLSK